MGKLNLKTIKIFSLVFFVSIFLLTGCISIKGDKKTVKTGPLGVYKSTDASETWKVKNDLLNIEAKKVNIDDATIKRIVMDPSDNKVLYLATDRGMFYSLKAADSWQKIDQFKDFSVNDVAVSYFDKCTVFVGSGQSIYRTTDCLRTWQQMYFDKTRENLQITDVETEDYNPNVIYAATNKGDVLKSSDNGKTWQTIQRLKSSVRQILIDKDDTRIIYIVTASKGLFKTTDSGQTWSHSKEETDLNEALDPFRDSEEGMYLVQDKTRKNTFIYASQYGLLKTTNGGMDWDEIDLITVARKVTIYSLAIDPVNSDIIYYGTDTTLYKSIDGGQNWATKNSPSGSIINFLLIDPTDPNIIYLGNKALPKK